jgi:hypothetical protein
MAGDRNQGIPTPFAVEEELHGKTQRFENGPEELISALLEELIRHLAVDLYVAGSIIHESGYL